MSCSCAERDHGLCLACVAADRALRLLAILRGSGAGTCALAASAHRVATMTGSTEDRHVVADFLAKVAAVRGPVEVGE
jgi:hypothetical protein